MLFNRRLAFFFALLSSGFILAGNASAQDQATFSLKVGRYRLQSNPWVNLHQRLMYEARFNGAPAVALYGNDLVKWNQNGLSLSRC